MNVKALVRNTLGALLAIALCLYFAPVLLALVWPDDSVADDRDLRLSTVQVPIAENAYPIVASFEGKLRPPASGSASVEALVTGRTWDAELVQRYLDENHSILAGLAETETRQVYQSPTLQYPARVTPAMPIPEMRQRYSALLLGSLRSASLARQGDHAAAMKAAFLPVRLASKMQGSQPLLLEYLIAVDAKIAGLYGVQENLATTDLGATDLRAYMDELGGLGDHGQGLSQSLKGEYRSIASGVKEFDRDQWPAWDMGFPVILFTGFGRDRFYHQSNRTLARIAGRYRSLIRSALGPCDKAQDLKRLEFPDEADIFRMLLRRNGLGEFFADVAGVSPRSVLRRCNDDTVVAGTQTLFALKIFRIENGRFPDSLDELTPGIIKKLPVDPYSGRPFVYSPSKRIIYSVGPDGKDSGGEADPHLLPIQRERGLTQLLESMPDPSFAVR